MNRIVRMTSEDPISPESIKRLKRLADMPDGQIRTDLIPETTREQFAAARAKRTLRAREQAEHLHQKAS